jgi:hypothetical protein
MTYEDVPEVEPDAEPDPHWLEIAPKPGRLPDFYLPPSMPGPRDPWTRVAAWVLIAVFLSATVCGVCLTYGVIP